MSTIGRRGSTWTNPDGLVVGFGTHKPAVEGTVAKNYGGAGSIKQACVTFGYKDAASANVPVPAGARVYDVTLVIEDAFVGGTSLTVGDGSSATGFITATAGATANLTAGKVVKGDGAYLFGATDTVASEVHVYASADTIDVAANGTFTAGKATLVVNYV